MLRTAMAGFALNHIGNRAFIAMLHTVGELTTHLGLFELDSTGAELVVGVGAELVVGAAQESHHGDGGAPLVNAGTPEATQRNFSDEEIRAVTWKCRLQKASLEYAHGLLNNLPNKCNEQMVQGYTNRPTEM